MGSWTTISYREIPRGIPHHSPSNCHPKSIKSLKMPNPSKSHHIFTDSHHSHHRPPFTTAPSWATCPGVPPSAPTPRRAPVLLRTAGGRRPSPRWGRTSAPWRRNGDALFFGAGETNLWSHGGIMEVARWRGWGRNSPPRSQNGHMIMGFSGMAERKFKNLPGFYHILQARASRALAKPMNSWGDIATICGSSLVCYPFLESLLKS